MQGAFRKFFRSDDLLGFRDLCARLAGKQDLARRITRIPDSVTVVVDTSQVVHQILWAVRKRRQADARTDLAEVIDSGLIRAHAPEVLRQEIEAKIPILAKEKGIAEEALWREWKLIEPALIFQKVRKSKPPKATRDIKDLPFVRLAKRIGAVGILTHDRDIPAMGGKTLSTSTLTKLRDYARARAASAGAFLSMVFWIVAIAMLIGPILAAIWKAIVWLFRKLGWRAVIVLCFIVALVIYCSKPLRDWIANRWRGVKKACKETWEAAAPHLVAAGDELGREELRARTLWKELSEELSLPPEPRGLGRSVQP